MCIRDSRYICGESSSLARDLRKAYNDLGFGRGNAIKDGLSLKDDQLNEMAARSTFRYLNLATPSAKFTSLIGGNPVQSTINLLPD